MEVVVFEGDEIVMLKVGNEDYFVEEVICFIVVFKNSCFIVIIKLFVKIFCIKKNCKLIYYYICKF